MKKEGQQDVQRDRQKLEHSKAQTNRQTDKKKETIVYFLKKLLEQVLTHFDVEKKKSSFERCHPLLDLPLIILQLKIIQ